MLQLPYHFSKNYRSNVLVTKNIRAACGVFFFVYLMHEKMKLLSPDKLSVVQFKV